MQCSQKHNNVLRCAFAQRNGGQPKMLCFQHHSFRCLLHQNWLTKSCHDLLYYLYISKLMTTRWIVARPNPIVLSCGKPDGLKRGLLSSCGFRTISQGRRWPLHNNLAQDLAKSFFLLMKSIEWALQWLTRRNYQNKSPGSIPFWCKLFEMWDENFLQTIQGLLNRETKNTLDTNTY